jgi:hypothetical protein
MYGCFDRQPFKEGVWVQDGWIEDVNTRHPAMKLIQLRNTTKCQYRHTELGQTDKGCEGCSWRNK